MEAGDGQEGLQQTTQAAQQGWWSRLVAVPLESFLQRFAPETEPLRDDGMTGNVGIVYLYLSGEPAEGEEICH